MASNGPRGRILSPDDWRSAYWATWSLIGWLALTAGAVWLLGRLWTVVLPLALGLVIVVFLRPLVEWLCDRGASRLIAVVLAYLVFASVLVGLVSLFAPVLVSQAEEFAAEAPDFASRIQRVLGSAQATYDRLRLPRWAIDAADALLEGLLGQVAEASRDIAPRLLAFGERALGIIVGVVTGLVVGFYLLLTLPRVGPGFLSNMPPGWRREARDAGARVEEVVGGYLRGQALIALLVGLMTWIGMTLAGVPFPALLGVIAGVGDIVPIVGPTIAAIVGIAVGLLVDPWLALWAVVIVVAVQQIEGAILSPRILGGRLGLHPVVIILSIIAATALYGIAGLLLAVPVVGTVKTLWAYYRERRGWTEVPAEDES